MKEKEEHEMPSVNQVTDPDDGNPPLSLVCTLGIHDNGFSKDEILVNASLFPFGEIPVGSPMQLLTLEQESPSGSFKRNGTTAVKSRQTSGERHITACFTTKR